MRVGCRHKTHSKSEVRQFYIRSRTLESQICNKHYFLPQRGVPLFLVPMVGLVELLRESRRRRKRAQRPRSPRGVTRTTRGPATRGNTRKETAGGRGIKREATTQTRKGGIRLGKFIPCEKNVDLVVYAPFSLATYYFSYD